MNWLLRQLKNAPESLRVEAFAAFARGASTAGLLREVREDAGVLIQDPKDIRGFRIALSAQLGTKRGRGRGGAIESVLEGVDYFYGEVLQHLKARTAAPPKMREVAELPDGRQPALVSTALSSQDGGEPVDESSSDKAHDEVADYEDGRVPEIPRS
ncbi:MAG: hypothetical protein JWQ37_3275 [Blastococcus sp.]|nr:hypothetical protein [Blastococcus sp.]